jgi:hypothetical protein
MPAPPLKHAGFTEHPLPLPLPPPVPTVPLAATTKLPPRSLPSAFTKPPPLLAALPSITFF